MDPNVENQLIEIAGFLNDPKSEVRQLALQSLAAYTPSQSHCWPFFRAHSDILQAFTQSLADPACVHDGLRGLINLSGDPLICEQLNGDVFLARLVQIATSAIAIETDLACMLLGNLTKDDAICKKLIDVSLVLDAPPLSLPTKDDEALEKGSPPLVEGQRFSIRVMDRLLQVFLRGESRGYNPNAEFHFLASVFANASLVLFFTFFPLYNLLVTGRAKIFLKK